MTRVGRTTLLVTPVVIVARGVAFMVPMFIAYLYGAGEVTDAFFYAISVPTFVMVLVSNALATVATPLLAQVQEQEAAHLPRFVGGVALSSGLIALSCGALLLAMLAPALPRITTFEEPVRDLTWLYVAELLPFIFLNGTSAILKVTCDVRGRFVEAAATPFFRGTAVLLGIAALKPALGPHALAAGLLCGELVQMTWLLGVLHRSGVMPIPNLTVDERLKRAATDAAPILGGEVLVALNVLVDKVFAGTLSGGSVSLLEYADRARFIPQTAMESTLLPVAFATWASLVAQGQRDRFARQVDQSLRWVAAWSAAPLAGLFIGRVVLIRILLERGAFTPEDTQAAASAFGYYIPGLWVMMMGTLAMRAHVVLRNLRLVLALGVVSVVTNATLDSLLVESMGIDGLALASTAVWVVVPLGYLAALYPAIRGRVQWRSWAGVIAIAAASLGVAVAVELGPGPPQELLEPNLWLASLPCFTLLGIAVWWTRVPRKDTVQAADPAPEE